MTVTVTEARADLPRLLDAVEQGHEVTITRHGRAVAVLMSKDAQRRHRTARAYEGAARIHQLLHAAGERPLFDGPTLDASSAENLAAGVRADRDADR